jgi:hypothetical protein
MDQSLEWRRSSAVAVVDDGHRVVVLDLSDLQPGRPQLLTTSAAAIWRILERPLTTSEVVDAVADRFDATSDEIGPVVAGFLKQLEDQRLVQSLERPHAELTGTDICCVLLPPSTYRTGQHHRGGTGL